MHHPHFGTFDTVAVCAPNDTFSRAKRAQKKKKNVKTVVVHRDDILDESRSVAVKTAPSVRSLTRATDAIDVKVNKPRLVDKLKRLFKRLSR